MMTKSVAMFFDTSQKSPPLTQVATGSYIGSYEGGRFKSPEE
jgi:hypothetical protein